MISPRLQSFINTLTARLEFRDARTKRALSKIEQDFDGQLAERIVRDLGSDTQPLHLTPPPANINQHDVSGND